MNSILRFIVRHDAHIIHIAWTLILVGISTGILLYFTDIDFVATLSLAVAASLSLTSIPWMIRHRPESPFVPDYRRKRPHMREDIVKPRAVEPHEVTLHVANLAPDESIYYDEAHHPIVTLFMLWNPSWGRDHDIKVETSETVGRLMSSKADRFAVETVRMLYSIVRMFVIFGLLGLPVSVLMVVYRDAEIVPDSTLYDVFMIIFVVLSLVSMVIVTKWILYIRDMASRFRLVLTSKAIRVVVAQLPWRDGVNISVPIDTFTQCHVFYTIVDRIIGSGRATLLTSDDSEPIPAVLWIRNMPLFVEVMRYFQAVNQPRQGSRGRRTNDVRDGGFGDSPAHRQDTVEIDVESPFEG